MAAPTRTAMTPGARVALSALALVLAVAALFGATALVGEDDAGAASHDAVPGKVSVLGGAKVRSWRGPTFTIEVPLQWQLAISGKATGVAATDIYRWVLVAPGASREDRRLSDPDWTTTRQVALAQINLQIGPAHKRADGSRAQAKLVGENRAVKAGYSFADVGPSYFPASTENPDRRYVWRLFVTADKQPETHYFFATCDKGKARESWQITFNRRSARAQQATQQAMLASLTTLYDASPPDTKNSRDCTSAAGS
jgi:hypothetical protein